MYHFCFILDVTAEDVDGWETVRRSRSKISPTSKASTSSKGSICSSGTGKFQKPSKVNSKSAAKLAANGRQQQPPSAKQSNAAKNRKPALSRSLENVGGASYRDAVVKASTDQPAG